MSTVELKKLLVKRIQSTDDKEFLNALRVLTDEKIHPVNSSVRKKLEKSLQDLEGGKVKPMTLKELFARDARAEKDIKAGRLIPAEEVRKPFAIKK